MSWIQKNRNFLIAIGAFIIVTFIYFSPLYTGKKLAGHDYISWRYISHEPMEYADSTGLLTYWANNQFGGMPTYGFYGNSKANILGDIYNFVVDHGLQEPMIYFLFSMISWFILLSLIRMNLWSRIVLSLVGTFVSYSTIITAAGHYTKMLTIGLMPAVIAAVLMIYNRKIWKGLIVLVLSMGIMLLRGMPQIEYYSIFFFVGLGIYEFIRLNKAGQQKAFWKSTAIIMGVVILSTMAAMFTILPLYKYSKLTMRGGESELTINKSEEEKGKKGGLDKDYAFSWSNSWGESLTSIIPMLYGGSSTEALPEDSHLGETLASIGVPQNSIEQFTQHAPTYWGDQPFVSGPIYFGAVVMMLFFIALFYYKKDNRWWILAGILITFFISLGSHFPAFNYFMFDHFPLFNKFRSPTMVLSLTYILILYFAAHSLYHMIFDEGKEELKKKALYYGGGVAIAIILLFGVFGNMFFDYTSPNDAQLQAQYMQIFQNNESVVNQIMTALKEDRFELAKSSAIRSLIFVLLGGGILYFYLIRKSKIPYIIAIVGLVALVDNFGIASKYLSEKNYITDEEFDANFYPRPVDTEILKDTDPFHRVLDLSVNTYNDAFPSYFHHNLGGYSPAKMEPIQDMIDMQLGGKYSGGKFNSAVLDMFNTKYLIVGQKGQEQIVPRPSAMGNAWFVPEIKWAQSADEEMQDLNSRFEGDTTNVPNAWNPRVSAVMRDNEDNAELKSLKLSTDSTANVKLVKYGLPFMTYESNNANDGLAVFSDIYYPKDWKVYIDGQESKIYRCNYLLRAVKIPKGKHTLEFKFEPQVLFSSIKISWVGSILAVILLIFALIKNSKTEENLEGVADD